MRRKKQTRHQPHKTHEHRSIKANTFKRTASKSSFMLIFIALFAIVGVTFLVLTRAATIGSVKSGNWNDPTVWGGQVPGANDMAVLNAGHTVTINTATSQVSGMKINSGATLAFKNDQTVTLESAKNIIVEGRLEMKPANASIRHTLRFTGINEQTMVGGGMNPLDSDTGLWVMGSGKLDVLGQTRSGWLRANGALASGATSVTLESVPVGWQVGDEVIVTPTDAPTVSGFDTGFDVRTISAINGATVTFNSGLARAHPKVNNLWTAEVANLTRNVMIEGTSGGRTHVFIRSNTPQTIHNAALRYMGPRFNCSTNPKCTGGDPTEFVLGRYGLHFHMSHDGSRGSQVFGTVIKDSGSHAYVPHKSHGIHFKDTVSYNTFEDAYWWDTVIDTRSEGDETHDTIYDHAMAALVKSDPAFRGYRLTGYSLGQGLRNTIRDSVAVGVQGSTDASGFGWPESSGPSLDSTVWNFSKGNIAHNNAVEGLFVWQNNHEPHVVSNWAAYHNGGFGVQHGAYGNNYHYENGHMYGNAEGALRIQAVGGEPVKQRWDNIIMDAAGLTDYLILSDDHTFDGTESPTVFRNNTFRNAKKAIMHITQDERTEPDSLDLEFPIVQNVPADVIWTDPPLATVIRIQNPGSSTATRITPAGRTTIPGFAPASQPDFSRPQIQFLNPAGGSTISGTASFNVFYHDLGTITKTDLYVDNLLRASFNGAPTTVSLNTSGLGSGPHQFHLQSTDSVGRTNRSALMTYTVQGGDPYVAPTPPANDTIKPYVDLFTPDKNEVISGFVPVTSEAWDNFGISKVEFYANNTLIGTDTTFPYEFIWNTWTMPNQEVTVIAKAYDFNGNTEIDDYANDININNSGSQPADTMPPDVVILSPNSGATVNGSFTVTASAVDDIAVSKVEFLVDGTLKTTDTNPPYSFTLDSTTLTNGTHNVTAKAFDNSNNASTSSPVVLNVNNGGTPPPPPTVKPEDINQDGIVNILDFSLLSAKFGQTSNLGRADINQDGKVNIIDFSMLAAKFGT